MLRVKGRSYQCTSDMQVGTPNKEHWIHMWSATDCLAQIKMKDLSEISVSIVRLFRSYPVSSVSKTTIGHDFFQFLFGSFQDLCEKVPGSRNGAGFWTRRYTGRCITSCRRGRIAAHSGMALRWLSGTTLSRDSTEQGHRSTCPSCSEGAFRAGIVFIHIRCRCADYSD